MWCSARLQATGYRLQATGYRLQATGYRLQAAGCRPNSFKICPAFYPEKLQEFTTLLIILI